MGVSRVAFIHPQIINIVIHHNVSEVYLKKKTKISSLAVISIRFFVYFEGISVIFHPMLHWCK